MLPETVLHLAPSSLNPSRAPITEFPLFRNRSTHVLPSGDDRSMINYSSSFFSFQKFAARHNEHDCHRQTEVRFRSRSPNSGDTFNVRIFAENFPLSDSSSWDCKINAIKPTTVRNCRTVAKLTKAEITRRARLYCTDEPFENFQITYTDIFTTDRWRLNKPVTRARVFCFEMRV